MLNCALNFPPLQAMFANRSVTVNHREENGKVIADIHTSALMHHKCHS